MSNTAIDLTSRITPRDGVKALAWVRPKPRRAGSLALPKALPAACDAGVHLGGKRLGRGVASGVAEGCEKPVPRIAIAVGSFWRGLAKRWRVVAQALDVRSRAWRERLAGHEAGGRLAGVPCLGLSRPLCRLALAVAAAAPLASHAATDRVCEPLRITNFDFGVLDADATGGAGTTSQGTITLSCSIPPGARCLYLERGTSNQKYLMRNADGDTIEFDLYRGEIGTHFKLKPPSSNQFDYDFQNTGRQATLAMYAQITSNGPFRLGTYTASFPSGAMVMTPTRFAFQDCDTNVIFNAAGFNVTVTVRPSCAVTVANDLNFGTYSSLEDDIYRNTMLQTRCTNGAPYKIGLDNGRNARGATRRMSDGRGRYISYELYRDANRTLRWGNDTTGGTDTVNGNGTGGNRTAMVYGHVAAQATPEAGDYRDTVTITVAY